MRKYFLSVLLIYAISFIAVNSYAWEISVENYMGGVTYKEEDSSLGFDVESDWKAFYNKTTLFLSDYDKKNIEGEIYYGIALTPQEEEKWYINDIEFQTNDMSFWGVDTGLMLGWAFSDLLSIDRMEVTITPLIGYRWKFIRFTRENFNILDIITIRETIDEDFHIHSLDVGGKISGEIHERCEFFVKPILGIILYSHAYNSVLGTVKGEGGYFFNIDAGLNYSVTEQLMLGAAFRAELQRIRGGEEDDMIWPDNTLDIYGATVNIKYKF